MTAPSAPTDTGAAQTAAPSTAQAPDPTLPCRQALANAAYPVANQMLYLTAAANLYPLTPNARPVVAPNFLYPFGGIFRPPFVPNLAVQGSLGALAAFPQNASPLAIVNGLAGLPGGFGALPAADQLAVAGVTQAQLGNVLAGIDTTQGVFNTRIGAAELNLAFAGFPRGQASALKDVIEGLLAYQQLACPQPGTSTSITFTD